MPSETMDHERFRIEMELRNTELALRKKELELRDKELELCSKEADAKKAEQKRKAISTPLVLAIIAAFLGFMANLGQRFLEHRDDIELDSLRFQQNLVLKVLDAKRTADLELLTNLLDPKRLEQTSTVLDTLRKILARQESSGGVDGQREMMQDTMSGLVNRDNFSGTYSQPAPAQDTLAGWLIIAGGDDTRKAAEDEVKRAQRAAFSNVKVYKKGAKYRTVIGPFLDYSAAVDALAQARSRVNGGAYITARASWCNNPRWQKEEDAVVCQ